MEIIKIGVIGLGRIGRVHAENLVYRIPNARLVAVADPDEETRTFANQLGVTNFYNDPAELLLDESINAILICSPTPTHFTLIEQAAVKGKHIFCEKPLGVSVEDGKKMVAAAEKSGAVNMIGFNYID